VAEVASCPITVPHRAPTEAEAWERFEAEFKPRNKSPSPAKRQIETMKYGLDVTVFSVDRFVRNIQRQADFRFDKGHLHRAPDDQVPPARGSPRVQLDMKVWRSKPYVGVKIVIPFGN
jgi:hypothetical protein